jgi:hypothetical protein
LSSAVIARSAALPNACVRARAALAARGQQDGRDPVVVQWRLLRERGGRREARPLHERARAAGIAADLGPQCLLHRALQPQRRHPQVVGPACHERSTRHAGREVPEDDGRLHRLAAEDPRQVARAGRAVRPARRHEREGPLRPPRRAEHARELEQALRAGEVGDRSRRHRVAVRDEQETPVERARPLGDHRPHVAPARGRDLPPSDRAHLEPEPPQLVRHVDRELLVARAARPPVGEARGQAALPLQVLPRPAAVERDGRERRADGARAVPQREGDDDEREHRRDQRRAVDPRVDHAR